MELGSNDEQTLPVSARVTPVVSDVELVAASRYPLPPQGSGIPAVNSCPTTFPKYNQGIKNCLQWQKYPTQVPPADERVPTDNPHWLPRSPPIPAVSTGLIRPSNSACSSAAASPASPGRHEAIS